MRPQTTESPGLAGTGAGIDSKADSLIITQPAPVAESAERYGAYPEEWERLQRAGIGGDMLPVLSNPHVPISPNSRIKKAGKVPSLYNHRRQLVGIPGWTGKKATAGGIARWSSEPDYGICVQTRPVRAIDGDINDAALPRSCRRLSRTSSDRCRLAGVRTAPDFSWRSSMPGEYQKRDIKTEHGVIEFLATGQQFVAAGQHESGFTI